MTYNDTISWIDVNESLPKVEERVLVLICRHSNYTNKDYKIVTCAIYEDGTTDIENSCWDCDSDSANYDKETDTCYIPKGWYEFHEYGDTENDGIVNESPKTIFRAEVIENLKGELREEIEIYADGAVVLLSSISKNKEDNIFVKYRPLSYPDIGNKYIVALNVYDSKLYVEKIQKYKE